jgi:hypothetical protein
MAEQWRAVPGFATYSVSDLGRVRGPRGWVLKQAINYRNSYHYVSLWAGGRQTSWNVHRIVLTSFVGPRPDGMDGSHLNGDKADNSLANLRWETKSENMRRQTDHGTRRDQRGEKNSMAKLTADDVAEVRRQLIDGCTQTAIARRYSVSSSLISMIHTGKIWGHVA